MLTVRVPLAALKLRGGRRPVLMPGGMAPPGAPAADTTLVKINSSNVPRLPRLTLVSLDLVKAILHGRQPEGMTLSGLVEPFPLEWGRQARGP